MSEHIDLIYRLEEDGSSTEFRNDFCLMVLHGNNKLNHLVEDAFSKQNVDLLKQQLEKHSNTHMLLKLLCCSESEIGFECTNPYGEEFGCTKILSFKKF